MTSLCPLVSNTVEERRLDRSLAKLVRLSKRRPASIKGRQAFAKDLLDTAHAMRSKRKGTSSELQRNVMRAHGRVWYSLPFQQKARYHSRAEILQTQAEKEKHEDIAHAKSDIQLQRER